MKKQFWGILAVSTLMTAGLTASTLTPAVALQATMDKQPLAPLDRTFLRTASQGNLAEVMTSRLALKKSQNKDVRMIAQMLVKDHSVAQSDLKLVAKQYKYRLPTKPNPMQQRMYRRLSSLSGASFDKEYMRGQVKAHNATVALFNQEMEDGKATQVRSYAAKYLPGIQGHTQLIHNVASNLGIPVAAPRKTAMSGSGHKGNM